LYNKENTTPNNGLFKCGIEEAEGQMAVCRHLRGKGHKRPENGRREDLWRIGLGLGADLNELSIQSTCPNSPLYPQFNNSGQQAKSPLKIWEWDKIKIKRKRPSSPYE
jgi:hypothetical protein